MFLKAIDLPKFYFLENNLNFQVKSTLIGKLLRLQDAMILQIIHDIGSKKPIYFAVTVSDDNRIGLDQYLQMEGMVFKLHPDKVPHINFERMKQNIIQAENVDFVIRTPEEFEDYIAVNDGVEDVAFVE